MSRASRRRRRISGAPTLNPERNEKVIVGFDRRFFSDRFAQITAEVLAANNFAVVLTPEPTPTPSISFAVKAQRAIGGVMITASHNPAIFNGFKLKSYYGGSSDSETCRAVEGFLDRNPVKTLPLAGAIEAGRVKIADVRPAHYAALKKLVDFQLIAKSKLRFAHDALFGVGAGCFEQLLAGTTCKVTTLNGEHDVLFGGINPEPVVQNYAASQAFLKKHPHDICLVTDGDADRVGGMDGHGGYLTTHQIICLLLHHLIVNRKGRARRVVKALTTTSMVDKMCAAYGLPLVETGVGFKYICAEMLKGDVLLGAEESGGIGFPGHIPERDGIAAGLMLLEMLATEKVSVNKTAGEAGETIWPASLRADRHALSAGTARCADGFFEKQSARQTVTLAACGHQDVRRREIRRAGHVVAHAARFRHGTRFADLRGGEVRCRRAAVAQTRGFIDTALKIPTMHA